MKAIILLIFVFFAFISVADDSGANSDYSWFEDPLYYSARVAEPQKAIVKALQTRKWQIESIENNLVVALLDGYKGAYIKLHIAYQDGRITIQTIEKRNANCESADSRRCKVDLDNYQRWRLYLRKSIAMELHRVELHDYYQASNATQQWVSSFNQYDREQRIEVARQIVETEWFDETLLDVFADFAQKNYPNVPAKNSRDASSEIVFVCKALARSKNPKYKPLLIEISQKAKSRYIKKYMVKYLNTYY